VDTVTNKIYVDHQDSDDITVIDGATNSTITVAVGKASSTLDFTSFKRPVDQEFARNRPHYIAVNPSTNKVYVTNLASNDVTVIDGKTNSVTTIPAGLHPLAIAVNYTTDKIYVSNKDSDGVTVIDGKTNRTNVVRVKEQWPGNIVINETTNMVYISCGNSKNPGAFPTRHPVIIDGNKDTIRTFIDDPCWTQVAIDPNANRIYEGGLSAAPGYAGHIIDCTSNRSTIVKAPTPLEWVTSVAVNPNTHRAYYSNVSGKKGDPVRSEIAIVGGLTGEIQEVKLGSLLPGDIAVDSVRNKIYITYFESDTVTEIDGASNAVSTVTTGAGNGNVTRDLGDTLVEGIMAGGTGKRPSQIVVNPVTNKIYVLNQKSSSVTVIDGNLVVAGK
jgi:YVTN family beta-propeller protein